MKISTFTSLLVVGVCLCAQLVGGKRRRKESPNQDDGTPQDKMDKFIEELDDESEAFVMQGGKHLQTGVNDLLTSLRNTVQCQEHNANFVVPAVQKAVKQIEGVVSWVQAIQAQVHEYVEGICESSGKVSVQQECITKRPNYVSEMKSLHQQFCESIKAKKDLNE